MPDEAKLKKMREFHFRIAKSCLTCKHRQIPQVRSHSMWGLCNKHEYDHQKHLGLLQFPSHLACVCDSYEEDLYSDGRLALGAYAELLKEEQ